MSDLFSAVRIDDTEKYFSEIEFSELNSKNNSGANLLHVAIAYGRNEIALDLIERGIDLNARNNEGMTPLVSSVISQRFKLAKVLIARGSDVNCRDNYGNDALWYAVGSPQIDLDLIELLLQAGADKYHRNHVSLSSIDVARQIGDELLKVMSAD